MHNRGGTWWLPRVVVLTIDFQEPPFVRPMVLGHLLLQLCVRPTSTYVYIHIYVFSCLRRRSFYVGAVVYF